MSGTMADGMMGRLQGLRQGNPLIWLMGLLALVPGLYLFFQGNYSLLLGLMAIGTVILVWNANRTIALGLLFAFLLTLGDLRRIIDMLAGSRPLDPLLLIGPIFTIYVTVPLLMRLKLSDTFSKAMLGLMALMCLEIFNPRQGPVIVGVSGVLFWLIPVLWFWVGRWLASEHILFVALYRVFFPLGVLDAALGIFQTYFGYLPWEEAWARPQIGQYFLGGGRVRPFGFSSSAAEYAVTIIIATVLAVAATFAGRKLYALALPILLPALFLSSSRGAIVKILFAVAMIWAVRGNRGHRWLLRLVTALTVGTALLIYSASTVASDQSPGMISNKSTSAELATAHVTQGLAHPLDDKYSTGGIHASIFWYGVVRGFTYPIGAGIGAVTLGAGKFGGNASISGSTEVDISDAFVSMGFIGGILYLFIVYRACALALEYVRTGPKMLSLACIGLLAALLGAWIPPSYAAGPLVWLCIGTIVVKINQQQKQTGGRPVTAR